MSRETGDAKILAQSEVNKKIIANTPKARPFEDLLGPFGRYDDENYEIYNRKKKQFYEACRKYKKMNQETLVCSRTRLHEHYMANLDCKFLIDDEADEDTLHKEKHDPKGRHIRKRTERPIHEVPNQKQMVCSLEPWFKRYLTLNKFIWAARTIVIQNRLMKVLNKLKGLNEEEIKKYENKRAITNVSYAGVFQKFLQD